MDSDSAQTNLTEVIMPPVKSKDILSVALNGENT